MFSHAFQQKGCHKRLSQGEVLIDLHSLLASRTSLAASSPPPSFASDYQSDASWWVENALPSERMHYCKAISNSFDIKQAERALRYMDRLYEKRLVA